MKELLLNKFVLAALLIAALLYAIVSIASPSKGHVEAPGAPSSSSHSSSSLY